jgi:hypothetical protein
MAVRVRGMAVQRKKRMEEDALYSRIGFAQFNDGRLTIEQH